MTLQILYSTEHGVKRLIGQPRDLKPRRPLATYARFANASADARSCFENYRRDLQKAYDAAAPWFAQIIESARLPEDDQRDTLRRAYNNRLAGAAAYPQVVSVVRNYWLHVDRLDSESSENEKVYPENLLLLWLEETSEAELVRLIACMPYWPMGLDEDGNWC